MSISRKKITMGHAIDIARQMHYAAYNPTPDTARPFNKVLISAAIVVQAPHIPECWVVQIEASFPGRPIQYLVPWYGACVWEPAQMVERIRQFNESDGRGGDAASD
ncbi:hypothetical protein [Microbacterium sp.]|uniref:hypothetical protein n=1 Tax=Microbacterium sp. TaxID=51671 RepID=UPI002E3777E4|nr:hypothetical protein [Microbacterium sp.]HEX5728446.1 hypothetical protein [Microbacterium sp.]